MTAAMDAETDLFFIFLVSLKPDILFLTNA